MKPVAAVLPALFALALPASPGVAGEASPYVGLERRELKALSSEEIQAYEEGSGMGLALAAELNGYPGPKHVLELAADLGLSAEQVQATRLVFDSMQSEGAGLGKEIVELERRLDDEFSDGSIDDSTLGELVARIAQLQGTLRLGHLAAHLRMVEILETAQVERYRRLRGYGPEGKAPGHRGHDPKRHGRH